MGYQHGYLLKNEIKESIQTFIKYHIDKYDLTFEECLSILDKTERYFPESIVDEMKGLADGSDLTYETVAVAQIIRMKYHCSVISAAGPATKDSKLYFARSLDWSGAIKNSSSGKYLNNHVLFVRIPKNGYASMYPGYCGFTVSYGGINENGISISVTGSYSNDETYYGLTERFRIIEVLDKAFSAYEAIEIINKNKTCGINIIISDSKTNQSFVIEQTANLTYIGKWNSSVESNRPCWKIDHVLRRTNFFINKTTAKTQRYCFDPRNPINLLSKIKPIHQYNSFYDFPQIYWAHYKALSRAIEDKFGSLDLYEIMSLLRGVYKGQNNLLFRFNNLFWKYLKIGCYPSHQWVACPENAEMIVSFSQSEKRAFEQPIHYFNLFDLIEENNNI